jgi:nucleotide-binding universal stress UspA family protein
MNDMHDGPVVVGFDASPASERAMRAAAVEASAAGVEVVVVHVYGWPIFYASLANIPFEEDQWHPSPEAVAAARLAADDLAQEYPGLKVSVSVPVGRAGEQLVSASRNASLLVIGATGASGVGGLLTGPVTPYVTAQAHCPVMVVRNAVPSGRRGGEVCVGVDGAPGSLTALRFARSWAWRRGASVRALYAVDAGTFDDGSPEERLRDWVAESLGDDAVVDAFVVRRSAVSALVAASSAARLVVVGAHHRGFMHGSVAQALTRRAACPVVVVPGQAASAPRHGVAQSLSTTD